MKIVVIGAGLIGLTSAYFLRLRGHQVTVLERQQGPGQETSFANGALLTPGMPEPWNAPGSWRVLLGSIGRSDAPLQLRLSVLPSLAGWGIRFLKNSSPASFERNTIRNLKLALHSLNVMKSLREATRVEYGGQIPGTLKLFRDPAALDRAASWARQLSRHGLNFRQLSSSETVALEPALGPIGNQLAGAIRYEVDETGDAYRFCTALARHLREQGVEFHYSTRVSSMEVAGRTVTAVFAGQEPFTADAYIVAACSYSAPLLRRIGVHLPVRPAKGYSVTFDPAPRIPTLRIPVVDDDYHAAVVPVGAAIRVAGTAEFNGYDLTLSAARIQNLVGLLRKILPEGGYDPSSARPWCGLRAMSADGVPLIGRTLLGNLFVNTGHGHLGWTMAAGSGQLLADLIFGTAPAVDPTPYDPMRFR
jgi:D-amino-acid dehydrogenase